MILHFLRKRAYNSISGWWDNFNGQYRWGDSALWLLSWRCQHSDLHQERGISIESSESVATFPRWSIQPFESALKNQIILIFQERNTTGNSQSTAVPRRSFQRMHPSHWANLLSLQLTWTLTCTIVWWQENRCPEFCIYSTRLQWIGMQRNKAQRKQLPMVPSSLLQEQRLNKSLTIASLEIPWSSR